MLKLAKVVTMRPADNSADILFLDNGAPAVGVPIMAGAGTSSRTGTVDQPAPTINAADKWAPQDSKDTDITAVVGWFGNQPIIMGFLYPQMSQMLFADIDRRISRHTSDVYSTIDKDGNAEFYHPSGAYIRFGTSPAHDDLTGLDLDAKWRITRNTDKAVHIHVGQAGGAASLDIAPGGAIVITTVADVTVNSPTSTVNGDAVVNGDVTVNEGDVIADGISLKNHTHGGITPGAAQTDAPA